MKLLAMIRARKIICWVINEILSGGSSMATRISKIKLGARNTSHLSKEMLPERTINLSIKSTVATEIWLIALIM